MKAVEMMKKAIKESELNGYKWTANRSGLHWNYGVDFKLVINKEEEWVKLVDEEAGVSSIVCVDERFADGDLFAGTYDEAIYVCAKHMIRTANRLY